MTSIRALVMPQGPIALSALIVGEGLRSGAAGTHRSRGGKGDRGFQHLASGGHAPGLRVRHCRPRARAIIGGPALEADDMSLRALAVCLAGAAALEQASAPQQPVFRTDVQLVRIDAVVVDGQGRAVGSEEHTSELQSQR